MEWVSDMAKSIRGISGDSTKTPENKNDEPITTRERSNAISNPDELGCATLKFSLSQAKEVTQQITYDYNNLKEEHKKLKEEHEKFKEEHDKLTTKYENDQKLLNRLKTSPKQCEKLLLEASTEKKLIPWYWQTAVHIPKILFILIFLAMVITLIILAEKPNKSKFENEEYDPFGTGIRFSQRRDDTGSPSTSLNERKYQPMVSQLTSNPEAPNFSEYYGIDASIKNGSVMIERENFENSALSLDELEKANKGL